MTWWQPHFFFWHMLFKKYICINFLGSWINCVCVCVLLLFLTHMVFFSSPGMITQTMVYISLENNQDIHYQKKYHSFYPRCLLSLRTGLIWKHFKGSWYFIGITSLSLLITHINQEEGCKPEKALAKNKGNLKELVEIKRKTDNEQQL